MMNKMPGDNYMAGLEVAVIGMAGRFPGARNIADFWDNLINGIESISFFSDEELLESGIDPGILKNPHYIKASGLLEDFDYFAASFFDYTPKEAEIMDPQIRVFHECSWEALEDAGYDPWRYPGLIGLYAGAGYNPCWTAYFLPGLNSYPEQFDVGILNAREYMNTRISYKMNLRGPSVAILTACSTSLAAIHAASQGILSGECDMALAGGVAILTPSLSLPKKSGYLYQDGMILARDGHCRAFDAAANGTVGGSGVGVVVLKALEDAIDDGDCIHAVIKGSAMNNDGIRKVGYTAPSVAGQAEVVKIAHKAAGICAEDIGYMEAFGVGTTLGDTIEIEALTRAFNTVKRGYCAIGSVKTNIGHLDTAAGVAGFIKTVLALKHKLIPPSLNFMKPNPKIDFNGTPFYVNSRLSAWKSNKKPMLAGVNAYGIGGTNVHIVLEEWQEEQKPGLADQGMFQSNLTQAGDGNLFTKWSHRLILLSAKTETALVNAARNLAAHLEKHPGIDLADAAYTLQVGRRNFLHRMAVVCPTGNGGRAVEALSTLAPGRVQTFLAKNETRSVIFMFPGRGAQYVNMGLDLYRELEDFRRELDRCIRVLQPLLGCDVGEILFPVENIAEANKKMNDAIYRGSINFIFEYSLAKLLMKWGIMPTAMIGHGAGEYTAACLAGVFSLEDALALTVLSGRSTGEFEKRVGEIKLNKPGIPYISGSTGKWVKDEEAVNLRCETHHITGTKRIHDGLKELLKEQQAVFIELGAGREMILFLEQHAAGGAGNLFVNMVRPPDEKVSDIHYTLSKIGELWLYGVNIDWHGFYDGEKRNRVPLPTYPFARERYYPPVDLQTGSEQGIKRKFPIKKGGAAVNESNLNYKRPNLSTPYVAPVDRREQLLVDTWKKVLGFEQIGVRDNFFELGGDSLKAIIVTSLIHKLFDVKVPIVYFFSKPTIAGLAEYIDNAEENVHAPIEAVEKKEFYPLSSAQKRMYVLNRMGKEDTVYNIPSAMMLEGRLDKIRLEQTLMKMAARHESLRTSFKLVEGEPVQVIHPISAIRFNVGDYDAARNVQGTESTGQNQDSEETGEALYSMRCVNIIDSFIRPFHLPRAPLFRAGLIKLPGEDSASPSPGNTDRHILMVDMHHIISDGTSIGILIEEFMHLYDKNNLASLKIQYKDYSAWQNIRKTRNTFKEQEEYWLKQFAGEIPLLNMPLDFNRPESHSFAGAKSKTAISAGLAERIRRIIRETGLTFPILLLAVYNVLLFKYTGQEDIIIGVLIAGRNHAYLQDIIGMFVNMLAVRNKPRPDETFLDFAAEVKTNVLNAFDNQDYQFEELIEKLKLEREPGRHPMIDVVFVFQNMEIPHLEIPGLKLKPYEFEREIAHFDLLFTAFEKENTIHCELEYATALFERSTAGEILKHYIEILDQAAENPGIKLEELTITQHLLTAEADMILQDRGGFGFEDDDI